VNGLTKPLALHVVHKNYGYLVIFSSPGDSCDAVQTKLQLSTNRVLKIGVPSDFH